jgi:hypothetical protein
MKNQVALLPLVLCALAIMGMFSRVQADAQLTSWFTTNSGKYARVYLTTAEADAQTSFTTWSNSSISQSLPAYAGVQEVDYSTNWVYVRCSGLGFHFMGPWYLDSQKTQIFPNLPLNTKTFYRIPRTPTNQVATNVNGGGPIGRFVDGVAMYNSWDAYTWNVTSNADVQNFTGYWNRDAYVNEGPSFDPSNAHQDQSGTYHYHVNPPGIRYLLGDSVSYNPATNGYYENPTNLHHSPILAWVADGHPLYGPYGYSSASNASSGIPRMVSGYVLRNGQNGTDNLTSTGRTHMPAWADLFYNLTGSATNQAGPNVSTSYPLGRYMEDNAHLGDVGKTQGVDFDLDQYNGRWCYTPEFPTGTYAYFVSISSNGIPVFPYNIGRAYKGNPVGGSVTALPETVTTNYLGGPNAPLQLNTPARNATNNTVTLTWSSIEGGTYQILSSTNLTNWTAQTTNIASQGIATQTNISSAAPVQFYTTEITALSNYDSVVSPGVGIASVSPTSGSRGTTVTLTINLESSANPPPSSAPINSVTVGTITGTNNVHVSSTEVTSGIYIPTNAATGTVTVTLVFPGPPDDPSNVLTYTLNNGFTIK